MSKSNPCSKTRKLDNPYEVWECKMVFGCECNQTNCIDTEVLNIEYRVLKKYKSPENEAKDPLARWHTAAKSEATFGNWEYGDMYAKDIISTGRRIDV